MERDIIRERKRRQFDMLSEYLEEHKHSHITFNWT